MTRLGLADAFISARLLLGFLCYHYGGCSAPGVTVCADRYRGWKLWLQSQKFRELGCDDPSCILYLLRGTLISPVPCSQRWSSSAVGGFWTLVLPSLSSGRASYLVCCLTVAVCESLERRRLCCWRRGSSPHPLFGLNHTQLRKAMGEFWVVQPLYVGSWWAM